MTRIDRTVASNLLRLQAPEFEPFVGYLNQVHLETMQMLVDVRDEAQLRTLQGRAQLARELLEMIRTSGSLVEKLK